MGLLFQIKAIFYNEMTNQIKVFGGITENKRPERCDRGPQSSGPEFTKMQPFLALLIKALFTKLLYTTTTERTRQNSYFKII